MKYIDYWIIGWLVFKLIIDIITINLLIIRFLRNGG